MKSKMFAILILIIPVSLLGQNRSDLRYFDKNWNPVLSKAQATYYRKIKDADSVYQVIDYYRSDSLLMDGFFSSISPALVHHGKATWYYEDGTIEKIGFFRKGKPVGIHKEYYKNGQLKAEVLHEGYKEYHLQRFDEQGNSLLNNGNGTFTATYMNTEYSYEVFDGQLLRSYYVNMAGDTIYGKATKPAVYLRGGSASFFENLREEVNYPDRFRKSGLEGTVLVSFVIDQKGNMVETRVVKSMGSDFDTNAVKTVQRNKDWKPAFYQGRAVPMRFVVPVVYIHRISEWGTSGIPSYGPASTFGW
jgi:periplasmic protein TonB